MRGAGSLLLAGLILPACLLLFQTGSLFLHLLSQLSRLACWLAGGLLSAFDHGRSPFCNSTGTDSGGVECDLTNLGTPPDDFTPAIL